MSQGLARFSSVPCKESSKMCEEPQQKRPDLAKGRNTTYVRTVAMRTHRQQFTHTDNGEHSQQEGQIQIFWTSVSVDLIASTVLRTGQNIPTLFHIKTCCQRTADQHRPRHSTDIIRSSSTSSSALVYMLKPAACPSAGARMLQLAFRTMYRYPPVHQNPPARKMW